MSRISYWRSLAYWRYSDSIRTSTRAISGLRGIADRLVPGRRRQSIERNRRIFDNMAVAKDLAPLRASAERTGQEPNARIDDAWAAVQGMEQSQRRRFVQEQLAADERLVEEAYKRRAGIGDDWDVIFTSEEREIGELELRRQAGVPQEYNARRRDVSTNLGGTWQQVPEPGDYYEAPRHREARADIPTHTPQPTDVSPTLDEWQAVDEVQAQQDLDARHPQAAQERAVHRAQLQDTVRLAPVRVPEQTVPSASAVPDPTAPRSVSARHHPDPLAAAAVAARGLGRAVEAPGTGVGETTKALAAADGSEIAEQRAASTDPEAVRTPRQTVDLAPDPADSGSGSPDSRTELVAAKIEHAWGSSVGEKGYGEPDEVAERLYDALYHPAQVVRGIQDRLPEGSRAPELHASTQEALESRGDMGAAPDRGEFVRTVSDTIVRGVPVAQTLLPGARDALAELGRRGVGVMAWSAGEPKHQHHKLADIGIVDPAIAPSVEPPIAVSSDFGPPLEVATAIAPDKTVPENMQKVAHFAGNRHLVVADDRTKNVIAFQQHFPDATGLWVQYGAHAAKSVAKLERGEDPAVAQAIEEGRIVPVSDIGELVPTIERLQREGRLPEDANLALASDVDDTLLNNDLRRDLQHAATLDAVQSRGWVAEPAANAPRPEPAATVHVAANPWLGRTTPSPAQSAGTQAAAAPTPALPKGRGEEASAHAPSPSPPLDTRSAASRAQESARTTANIVAASLPPASSLVHGDHVEPSALPPAVPPVAAEQDKGLGFEREQSR